MIMLVTDRRRLSPGATEHQAADRLVDHVREAAHAGIDLIQIRERDLDTRALAELARRCVSAVTGTKARVLVNDRSDIALAVNGHGVHLRADSISAADARSILPTDALIGRSVHTGERAIRPNGLDYIVFGTMFGTASKPSSQPLASVDELSAVCHAVSLPVLAIGGMTVERARVAAQAGAAGVAAIGLFIPPPGVSVRAHVRGVSADLRRVFDTCGAVP